MINEESKEYQDEESKFAKDEDTNDISHLTKSMKKRYTIFLYPFRPKTEQDKRDRLLFLAKREIVKKKRRRPRMRKTSHHPKMPEEEEKEYHRVNTIVF